MGKKALRNGINALLDNMCKDIARQAIRVYGDNDWPEINAALAEWEKQGFLKILIPPETADDNQICVRMLKYIDIKSPWGDKWP
jgi:hypothetical protein